MNIQHFGIWQTNINEVAKKLIRMGYSDSYIESVMYAGRGYETSIKHITQAIKQAKTSL